MLKKMLILLPILALLACGHVGGDVDPGITACEALEGSSTWNPLTYEGESIDSKDPISSLSVVGGLAQGFSSSGGKLKLNVQLKDQAGNYIFNGLSASDFELSASLEIKAASSFVNLTADVQSAKVSQIETASALVAMPTEGGLPGANIIMLYDSSGSTASTDPDRARVSAGKKFVDQLNYAAQVVVMDFGVVKDGSLFDKVVSDCFGECRFLNDFSTNHDLIKTSIARVTSAGGTPLYAAIDDSIKLMKAVQKEGAKRFDLLIFTDGQAIDYSKSHASEIIEQAKSLNARIHTIALQEDKEDVNAENQIDIENLQRLSEQTNGTSLTTTNASSLSDEFEQVAQATNAVGSVYVVLDIQTDGLKSGLYTAKGNLKSSANGGRADDDFEVTFQVE
jgi:Mg-chelatase subunit ChlD